MVTLAPRQILETATVPPDTPRHVTVRTIRNFATLERGLVTLATPGRTVRALIPPEFAVFDTADLRVIHLGRVVPPEEWDTLYISGGEELIVGPEVRVAALIWIGTYIILPMIISYGTGLLMNKLFPPPKPAKGPNFGGTDSPTYSFDGIQNTARNGQPVGVVYGTHLVGGQIVQLSTRTPESGKSTLYMLIGLGEGEFQEIAGQTADADDVAAGSATGLSVNGSPLSNYDGTVTVSVRLGDDDQATIPGFRDVTSTNNNGAALTQSTPVTHTTAAAVEAFELNTSFAQGAYALGTDGSFQPFNCAFRYRYRVSPAGAWSGYTTFGGDYRHRSPITVTTRRDGLALAVYDVEVERTSANPNGTTQLGATTLASVNEITYDDLRYPFLALLAIKAVATEKLYGGTPTVTTVCKGKKVRIWSGSAWSVAWSDNPAWCLVDVLTNVRYGLGTFIDEDGLDLASFKTLADYCDALVDDGAGGTHKRHTLNAVFDGTQSGWEIVQQICAACRAIVIKTGNTVRVKVQQVETPAQLFGVANVVAGSLKIQYVSVKDRANLLEIQYLNDANSYEQDVEQAEDATAQADGDDFRKEQVSLYGITRRAHAQREAIFHLNVSRLTRRIITFEVGIDALAVEPGDVIRFQHDLPQWGFSGRVVSSTNSTVVLDKDVTVGAGSYRVLVRHADDTTEEKTVTTGAGTVRTLDISGTWTANPAAADVWAFGLVNVVTKPFRVVGIKRKTDLTAEVQATEYADAMYTDTIAALPTITYTALPDPRKVPSPVTSLVLAERVVRSQDGTRRSVIDASFVLPVSQELAGARVFYKPSTSSLWLFVGTAEKIGFFTIDDNLTVGLTYDVSVASVSRYGAHRDPGAAVTGQIALDGVTDRPSTPASFSLVRVGDDLYFSWDPNAATEDVVGYELRVGPSWATATKLVDVLDGTRWSTSNFAPGNHSFHLKAKNTAGLDSLLPATLVADVDPRINQNVVVSRDEKALAWPGTKVNMAATSAGYLRQTVGQATGSYTTPEVDPGGTVRARVYVDLSASQVDVLTVWNALTSPWNTYTNRVWHGPADTTYASTVLQFRTSTDGGTTWGAWATFVVGEYTFDRIQFRVNATTTTPAQYVVQLNKMVITLDVPDVFDSKNAVAIPASATAVVFLSTFKATPAIVVTLRDAAQGDYWTITSPSTTGFTITIRDSAGTIKGGTIDWVARGY